MLFVIFTLSEEDSGDERNEENGPRGELGLAEELRCGRAKCESSSGSRTSRSGMARFGFGGAVVGTGFGGAAGGGSDVGDGGWVKPALGFRPVNSSRSSGRQSRLAGDTPTICQKQISNQRQVGKKI